jgi:YaiO family outer membrane protein
VVRLLLVLGCAAGLTAADMSEGLRLKAEGRFSEAEAVFRELTQTAPSDADAAAQLATVVGWQGRHAEAETLWARAVQLRPDDADLRTGLARVRWWRGDVAGAQRELDRVLASHPAHAEALALARDVDRAQQRLGWRVDLVAIGERFSAVFGEARTLGAGLAATWHGLGTLSAGGQRRWIADGDETTARIGLGLPLGRTLTVEAAGEHTANPILAARAALSAEATWRPLDGLAAVGGWRRSWFAGDHIDLYRPGLRWFPLADALADSHLEGRVLLARSPVSGVHGGASLRATLAWTGGWSAGLGYAIAEEAEPPRDPTRVVTRSLGVAWNGPAWGARLDWEHEDRRNDWTRDGLSLGAHVRW